MCEDHIVLRRDYPDQLCSIANSLEVIGERWSLLIVRDVFNGNRRFGEMQASLGVARNVLSSRLQRLVGVGDRRNALRFAPQAGLLAQLWRMR